MAFSSISSVILRRCCRNISPSSSSWSSSSSLLRLNQQSWCCSFLNHTSSCYCTSNTDNADSDNDITGSTITNPIPLTTPRLFISGLSRLTTDEKLKATFSPYGQLREAKVVTDRVTGRSKGFAFIRYATIEEAEKARQGMNAKFLDGWVIFVDPAKPREPRPRPPPEQAQPETGFKINKTVGWCG